MTHPLWNSEDFGRFGSQPDQSVADAAKPAHAPQKDMNLQYADQFRRKLREAGKNRHKTVGPEGAWPAYMVPVQSQDPARHPNQVPTNSRSSRRRIFRAFLIPAVGLAMVGVFVLGYQGSELIVGYLDNDKNKFAQAALRPVKSLAALTAAPRTQSAPAPIPAALDEAEDTQQSVVTSPSVTSETAKSASLTTQDALAAGRDEAPAAGEPSLKHAARLMAEGHGLLANGDVLGARDLFTRGLKLGLPEAALALGRSYDPKYLAQLPDSNAAPDITLASYLYRDWYNRSAAAGAIAPGVQLDGLIQSMNSGKRSPN